MATKCKFCDHVHEDWQAHIFHAATNAVAKPIPVAKQSVAKHPDTMRVQLWREANRERYNARQRELMRRRKAQA